MANNITERCENKENHLKDAIQKVYETKDFCDVTFTVGRKKFKGHKLILASRCSEFKRLLLDADSDALDIIVEDDSVTETGFGILLRFCYTDTLGTDDKFSIIEAYLAAKFYSQKKLMATCEGLMDGWSIIVDEACALLNISVRFGIFRLQEKCLNFIKRNAADVVESPAFFKLSYEAMVYILDNDALDAIGVKKRFIKIVEWGEKQQKTPGDYAAVRNYFLNNDPPLMGKLKIQEINLSEDSNLFLVTYKSLLTPDEFMKFMEYQLVKDEKVLPAWCTTK